MNKVFHMSGNDESDIAELQAFLHHDGFGLGCTDGYLDGKPGSGRFFTVGKCPNGEEFASTRIINWKDQEITVEPITSDVKNSALTMILAAMKRLGITDTFSYYETCNAASR